MRRFLAPGLWLALAGHAYAFGGAPTDYANGLRAYQDMVESGRFWTGSATQGFPEKPSGGTQFGTIGGQQQLPQILGSTQSMENLIYTCFKVCPQPQQSDAANRMVAMYNWATALYPASQWASCATAGGGIGTALDSCSRAALFMLQVEDALLTIGGYSTQAANAASLAEAAMGWAYTNWCSDGVAGGGCYYDDTHTTKNSDTAYLAWDFLEDYRMNGVSASLTTAEALESWAATPTSTCTCLLDNNGSGLWYASVNIATPPNYSAPAIYNSGQVVAYPSNTTSYYQSLINGNTGNTPSTSPGAWQSGASATTQGTAANQPILSNIHFGGAALWTYGQMMWAVVDARLYNLTSTQAYLTRLQNTAAAMLPNVSIPSAINGYQANPFGTIIMPAGDGFVPGDESYYMLRDVAPLLANPQSWYVFAKATAESVESARDTFGGRSGDWQTATNVWAQIGYPNWSSTTTYASGASVMYPANANFFYTSNFSGNVNTPPGTSTCGSGTQACWTQAFPNQVTSANVQTAASAAEVEIAFMLIAPQN